jgi:hypothetical protein
MNTPPSEITDPTPDPTHYESILRQMPPKALRVLLDGLECLYENEAREPEGNPDEPHLAALLETTRRLVPPRRRYLGEAP